MPLWLATVAFVAMQTSSPESESARQARFERLNDRIGHTYEDNYRAAAKIKMGRPVDDESAWILASAYFARFVSGCGAVELPISREKDWEFGSNRGAGPFTGPIIFVEKATGFTRSAKRPTVKNTSLYAEK